MGSGTMIGGKRDGDIMTRMAQRIKVGGKRDERKANQWMTIGSQDKG